MARRSIVKKLKNKPRKTRGEVFLINMKYFGDEPKFDHIDLTESDIGKAYNWYNYMLSQEESKEYVVEWLTANRPKLVKRFNQIQYPILNWGWTCRLLNQGYNLPDSYVNRMVDALSVEITPIERPMEGRVYPRKNVIGDLEKIVDENDPSFKMYDYILGQEISRPVALDIKAYYLPLLEEWKLIVDGKDPQLKEGYSQMTLTEKRQRLAFFDRMISDIDRFCDNKLKTRKPRKKKSIDKSKLVTGFQYLKHDSESNFVSIDPMRIFESDMVILYNKKYGTVTRLFASEGKKFEIKGTTIYNVDETKSETKRLGRKKDLLTSLNSEGKRYINNQWKMLKATNAPLQKRGNADTILLRAFNG